MLVLLRAVATGAITNIATRIKRIPISIFLPPLFECNIFSFVYQALYGREESFIPLPLEGCLTCNFDMLLSLEEIHLLQKQENLLPFLL